MVFYLYVVDERRHLVGVVSLRRLLLVPPETPLKRIMTSDVYSVRADTDQEEVARQVAMHPPQDLPGAHGGPLRRLAVGGQPGGQPIGVEIKQVDGDNGHWANRVDQRE